MRILLIATVLTLMTPPVLQAQHSEVPDSVHLRNDCRLATQVVRSGHPESKLAWAYSQIPACGAAGGEALAERFRELRLSRDAGTVQVVTEPAARLRDRSVYETSLEIAADRSASDVARAYAFRNLIWLIAGAANPVFTPWDPAGLGCNGYVMDRTQFMGTPLGSGYAEEIKDLARRVFSDTSEPPAVRYGARCVLVYARAGAQPAP